MPACNRCTKQFDWGRDENGAWVPLEPVETHGDLDRTYVDENGVARADHRDRHEKNGSGVNVQRLTTKIPAGIAAENEAEVAKVAKRRTRKQPA